MGNYLSAVVAVFIPVTVYTITIPWLYSPFVLGSKSSWVPPTETSIQFMYYILIYFFLWILATISSSMSTLKECNTFDIVESMKYANFTALYGFAGLIVLNTILFPFIKPSFLTALGPLPYARHLVNGIFIGAFYYFGGAYVNIKLQKKVCEGPPPKKK